MITRMATIVLGFLAQSVMAGPTTRAAIHPDVAAAYSEQHKGVAFLVLQDDKVVFERYAGRFTASRPHMLASGTKTFTGVAAAAMVADGVLTYDELACDTLTEWKSDPRKSKITVRQLLSLTDGLDPAKEKLDDRSVDDRVAYSLTQVAAVAEPGTKFAYGPSHYYAVGELMKRKLASADPPYKDVADYVRQRVLDPIGMRVAWWARDRAGNVNLPGGGFCTAREWAKLGTLLVHGGAWEGKQLIAADALREMTKGSQANPAYGLTVWLNGATAGDNGPGVADFTTRRLIRRGSSAAAISPAAPPDTFMAAGKGQQRLYVIPSRGLVVVRFADEDISFSDNELLSLLLQGRRVSDSGD